MSLIKTHHDHLTRHNEAIRPGICPALKHLLFQTSESGQKWFYSSGENGVSSPTVPLHPCQGLSAAQLFVHLLSSTIWAQGHPHTAPARSLAPAQCAAHLLLLLCMFFSLFPAVTPSLFTGAGTGCHDNKACATILQSPSQTSK